MDTLVKPSGITAQAQDILDRHDRGGLVGYEFAKLAAPVMRQMLAIAKHRDQLKGWLEKCQQDLIDSRDAYRVVCSQMDELEKYANRLEDAVGMVQTEVINKRPSDIQRLSFDSTITVITTQQGA